MFCDTVLINVCIKTFIYMQRFVAVVCFVLCLNSQPLNGRIIICPQPFDSSTLNVTTEIKKKGKDISLVLSKRTKGYRTT